jgi:hypothetical protein
LATTAFLRRRFFGAAAGAATAFLAAAFLRFGAAFFLATTFLAAFLRFGAAFFLAAAFLRFGAAFLAATFLAAFLRFGAAFLATTFLAAAFLRFGAAFLTLWRYCFHSGLLALWSRFLSCSHVLLQSEWSDPSPDLFMDKRVSNWRTMPALCAKYLSACREILFQQICAVVKNFCLSKMNLLEL